MKNWLTKINLPLVAFLAYVGRLLYFGSNPSDAAVLLVLASLYGFIKYLKHIEYNKTEQEFRERIESSIQDLHSKVSGLQLGQSQVSHSMSRRNNFGIGQGKK